jgi:hypothetical protein
MKILGVANTIMLHLERDEAIALINVLDDSNGEALVKIAREGHRALFAEIVRPDRYLPRISRPVGQIKLDISSCAPCSLIRSPAA